ncbi:hypothetical protein [uncultured Mitsuokella sp.]|uniref:hypothetical protein n=1 Tax=uncultured Mitsuokella sp. TaxID=453120 RepID=UPI0025828499|nr:hypothetical protein [uncultured Mitsuokella sp.]
MAEFVISTARMILHGIDSIGSNQKRDYMKHVPKNASQASAERWHDIGQRLRQATDKVVGKYSKV